MRSQSNFQWKLQDRTIAYRDQRIIRESPPVWTKLYNRKSITLNGSNEFTEHADVLGFSRTDPWSVCAWVKSTDMDGYIISKLTSGLTGWGFLLAGGQIRLGLLNRSTVKDEVDSTASVNDGIWHHLGGTSAGTGVAGMLLYLDGLPAAKTTNYNTLGTASIANSQVVNIGCRSSGSFLLAGTVDELAVFDIVLTPAQMSQVYRARDLRLLPFSKHLLGYWSGDGSDGTNVPDYSGNGYHGVPQAMDASNFTTDVPTPT